MLLDEYQNIYYDKNQKITLNLFKNFLSKAIKICDGLCYKNGIIFQNLSQIQDEYLNITTFELENGWQLDYKIHRYYYDAHVKAASSWIWEKKLCLRRTITIYADDRRCENLNYEWNALFQIATKNEMENPQYEIDDFDTYINPRLSLICKMNRNNLRALNFDIFFDSYNKDTYALKKWYNYTFRVIQGNLEEINLMRELIESLNKIRIIKSCLCRNENDRFHSDNADLTLPLITSQEKVKKKI